MKSGALNMIRQILSVIVVGSLASAGYAQEWGDLEGTFLFKGTPPTPAKINVDKDQQYCGPHNPVDETIVVNKDNKGLANVVVYLNDPPPAKQKIHPDYEKDAKAEVIVDNEKCRFAPHVQGIRAGQTLVLGNKDPIGHNTKADFFNNTPFNDLIPAGGAVKKTNFSESEATPTEISCSIHPWMNGYLLVRDNPYFAVSDKDGKFTIKNLPAGEHTFKIWHETGYVGKASLGGKAATWQRGSAKFTIKAGANDLGKIEISPAPKNP
jgi:plastocyanin